MNTPNLMTKKVLIIDDNPGILLAMKMSLQLKQYEAHTHETFRGVEAINELAPDLIYLDMSLVGQSGRDVAQELKGDSRTKNIPIVIFTAYANGEELAKEAGADDFLLKPFELALLWEMTAKYTA